MQFVTIPHTPIEEARAILDSAPNASASIEETMRKPRTSKLYAASRKSRAPADADQRELALLQEFTRSTSVASLAGAIADRLGLTVRPEDLVREAGLPSEGDTVTKGN
jgi:hypothetical protein